MSILKINILPIMVIYFVCQTVKASDGAHACENFTLDKCSAEGLIEIVNDVNDEDDCQFFCSVIYADEGCKFYIYDTQLLVCELRNMDIDTYVNTCSQIGGPLEANVKNCTDSTDPCKYFLQGFCEYKGKKLDSFSDIKTVDMCQQTCDHRPPCAYFLYDKETETCELLSTNEKECDDNYGLPEPAYTEC